MIILDATSQRIEVVLPRNVTTNQLEWNTTYVDVTTSTYTPGSSLGATNNTTPEIIVDAPGVSTQRQVKLITVYNKDTVAQVVIIQKVTAGGTRVLCSIS